LTGRRRKTLWLASGFMHFAYGILHSWNETTFKLSVRARTVNNGMYFIICKIGLNLKFKCSFTLHTQHAVCKRDIFLCLIITILFHDVANSRTFKDGLSLYRFMLYLEICSGNEAWNRLVRLPLNGFSDSLHTHKTPYDFLLLDLGHCLLIQRRYIRWTMG